MHVSRYRPGKDMEKQADIYREGSKGHSLRQQPSSPKLHITILQMSLSCYPFFGEASAYYHLLHTLISGVLVRIFDGPADI